MLQEWVVHSHSVVFYTKDCCFVLTSLSFCNQSTLALQPPAGTRRNTSTLSCCKPHLMGFSVNIFWSSRVRVSKHLGLKMVWHAVGLSPPGPLNLIWLSWMQERVTWGHCERHAWLAHHSARLSWIEGQLFRKDMKFIPWMWCDIFFHGSSRQEVGGPLPEFSRPSWSDDCQKCEHKVGWLDRFLTQFALKVNTVICTIHMHSLFLKLKPFFFFNNVCNIYIYICKYAI